jgi:hypothetical protein
MRLISDRPRTAIQVDTSFVNPWGIALAPTGPLWVVNDGSGVLTSLRAGELPRRVVAVPRVANVRGPARPTGLIFNDSPDFPLS